jgi:hypothetical protein
MRRSHFVLGYGSLAYLFASLWFGTAFAGPAGTTLSVTKTAVATLTQSDTYDWSIQKSTPPAQVTYVVPLGQSAVVPFTITATQTGPTVISASSVSGNVCITNTGTAATVGLQIIDTLEFLNGTVWQPVSGGQQALPVSAELAAGASQCYPYQFTNITLDPSLQYRNVGEAFIDNYLGHEGTSFETDATLPFTVTVVTNTVDATAALTDVLTCPTGFTCTASALPPTLTGSTVLNYSVTVTNNSVPCGQTVTLLNTATLVQSDTHTSRSASASVQIYTGTCPIVPTIPSLGTAASFAVLGASTVTNTGASIVTGNLGVSPGTAITGFPPGTVVAGTTHPGDAVALQAQTDAATAYSNLAGQSCNTILTGQDLGGLTLTPGTYCFATSAQLTGILTLNAQGNPNAVFIFKIGSTLTTAAASSVVVINGGSDCNVFWQVGTSATLGANTTFAGNLLAEASITLGNASSVIGRTLALSAAVTMDTDTVSNASCGP